MKETFSIEQRNNGLATLIICLGMIFGFIVALIIRVNFSSDDPTKPKYFFWGAITIFGALGLIIAKKLKTSVYKISLDNQKLVIEKTLKGKKASILWDNTLDQIFEIGLLKQDRKVGLKLKDNKNKIFLNLIGIELYGKPTVDEISRLQNSIMDNLGIKQDLKKKRNLLTGECWYKVS